MADLGQLQRVANFLGIGSRQKKPPSPDRGVVGVGVLGASQVATYALLAPARQLSTAEVVAVAARDAPRARQYARQHCIARAYGCYDELLQDPAVRAVFIGLPNGLHGQWARRALEAGKHVLCEKPFGANAAETREVQALAMSKGLLCREAFHYREHPLAARLRELTLGHGPARPGAPALPAWAAEPAEPGGGGVLGRLQHIGVRVLIPSWVFGGANIRFQEELAGGCAMDAGCYCVSVLRLLSGAEPRVDAAVATLRPGSQVVDGAMRATLSWPGLPGLHGTLHASLQHRGWLPVTDISVVGDRGSLSCQGFVVPFFGHVLRVALPHHAPLPGAHGAAPGAAAPLLLGQEQQQQQQQQQMMMMPGPARGVPFCPDPALPTAGCDAAVAAAGAAAAGDAGALEGLGARGWTERVFGPEQQTTYYHQLERFTRDLLVLEGGRGSRRDLASVRAALALDARDSVANQAVIDACYVAAGLPLRVPTAQWRARAAAAQQRG